MSEARASTGPVLVQVVTVEGGREIGWGSSLAAVQDRVDDVRDAIFAGAQAVAESLPGLPSAPAWNLREVSAKFGVSLTADGGVILTRAGVGTTFEVTVRFERL